MTHSQNVQIKLISIAILQNITIVNKIEKYIIFKKHKWKCHGIFFGIKNFLSFLYFS